MFHYSILHLPDGTGDLLSLGRLLCVCSSGLLGNTTNSLLLSYNWLLTSNWLLGISGIVVTSGDGCTDNWGGGDGSGSLGFTVRGGDTGTGVGLGV
jgi:hypothetical protein